jgi:hypothetical protein
VARGAAALQRALAQLLERDEQRLSPLLKQLIGIVRIERTVRPCLPIKRPRSSFATRTSITDAQSPCVSFTSTASGLFTDGRTRNWTSSFMVGTANQG